MVVQWESTEACRRRPPVLSIPKSLTGAARALPLRPCPPRPCEQRARSAAITLHASATACNKTSIPPTALISCALQPIFSTRMAMRRGASSSASSACTDVFFEASPSTAYCIASAGGGGSSQEEAVPANAAAEHSSHPLAASWNAPGTQLFTITERSSATTMKTLPLDGTSQRRIASARPDISGAIPPQPPCPQTLRHRDCFSVDERAMQKPRLYSEA